MKSRAAAISILCAVVTSHASPNVVLIVTDDQGYGDFGFAGNPHLQTPHLDRLASESPKVERFYVSPTCSPTRAALMTGRYAYRTGLVATNSGQSEMDAAEYTLAEAFRDAGYFTGLYGKWHLGDHWPRRPQDQGFADVLTHRGGGLAQPSEPPENDGRYTNPILFHNGKQIATKGYCTDVYFDYSIRALKEAHQKGLPAFIAITPNTPHDPIHDVPPSLYEKYLAMEGTLREWPIIEEGFPVKDEGELNSVDTLARIYAMIENIDANIGRLIMTLDELGIANDTLVVFLSDNGPKGRRHLAGLRGEKAEVFEGGIRSPLVMRWLGVLKSSHVVTEPLAHIDLMPTLIAAAGIAPREPAPRWDGLNAWPLLTNQTNRLPDRWIFLQSHRGNTPELYRNAAMISRRWKWLVPTHHLYPLPKGEPPWHLFDLNADPFEKVNLAASENKTELSCRLIYESWFREVTARAYGPPTIFLRGQPMVTSLTSMDRWHERTNSWADPIGSWRISTQEKLTVELKPIPTPESETTQVHLDFPERDTFWNGKAGELWRITLPPGTHVLRGWEVNRKQQRRLHQVEISVHD